MAYDRHRGVTVMFGGANLAGCDGEGALCRAIVWEWNGTSWSAIDTAGAGPAPRQGHAMTWDDERGVVVLFGGKPDVDYGGAPPATGCDGRDLCDTVWQWDGVAWTAIIPEDVGDGVPPGREGHVLGFDPVSREVLLVGGSRQFTPSPAEAGGFGECETCGFTWLWNGTRWRIATRVPAVSLDESRRAVTDRDRGRLAVVGRNIDGSAALDVRIWSGTEWSAAPLVDPEGDGSPLGGLAPAVAWDDRRGVAVIVGGDPYDGVNDDATWLLDLGGRRAVGQQFAFTFAAAGAAPDVALRSLRLDVDASGERRLIDGSTSTATELLVWDGRWRPVAVGAGSLAYATTNPVEIRRLLVGAGLTVNVSVRGAPTEDAAATTITTDRAALTLTYRLSGDAR